MNFLSFLKPTKYAKTIYEHAKDKCSYLNNRLEQRL